MATTKEGIEYNVGDKYTAPSGAKYTITSIDSDYIGVDNQISMERNDLENDFDKGIRKLHIKSNNMNKYNIEVGDTCGGTTVALVDSYGISFSDSASVGFWAWDRVNREIAAGTSEWKLVKKNAGKIIGYTLLKDTPEIVKGTQLIYNSEFQRYENKGIKLTHYRKDTVESQPEWFSPIYEEVKPTSVVVRTNAGDVTVTKDELFIKGEAPVKIDSAQRVFALLNKATDRVSGFNVVVETFKVGCKTFHVSDIPKLEEAIKQVS